MPTELLSDTDWETLKRQTNYPQMYAALSAIHREKGWQAPESAAEEFLRATAGLFYRSVETNHAHPGQRFPV